MQLHRPDKLQAVVFVRSRPARTARGSWGGLTRCSVMEPSSNDPPSDSKGWIPSGLPRISV
jgi:hypothetical protein